MTRAAVALGSNLGDPEAQVNRGFEELAALPDTELVARSRLFRTAPVGYVDQPDFVNACAVLETALAPRALLDSLLAIEHRHGRVRAIPNGPRTLDLDIILYGDRVIDEAGLKVPHPRAHERMFVLSPLHDAWPEAVIPGQGPVRDLVRPPVKHRHIVVEGAIGAGKTSLANRLSRRLGATTLLEDPAANPFLESFYGDMRRHALSTQLFFLFQRVQQLEGLRQRDLFGEPVVADFMLEKDPIFARLTLDDAEYALYSRIYGHVKPQAATPDLVIYLQASVDTLMQRVRKRGIPSESGIEESYLRSLAEAYTRYFHAYAASPLLIVNSDRLNFADNDEHLDLLVERIGAMRGGREFFSVR